MSLVPILSLLVLSVFCGFASTCHNFKWQPFSSEKHLAALVLARGGSKGIPLKNLAKVGGETLLSLSLNAIKSSKTFSSVWVSTDNELIAFEADKVGANIHWRSDESATDKASSIFAVQEFLEKHPEIDFLGLVQCTSPFVNGKYLKKGANLIRNSAECVFSVTRSFKLKWKELVGGLVVPLNFDPKHRPRRQDLVGELEENGMFYFASRNLINLGQFQSDK